MSTNANASRERGAAYQNTHPDYNTDNLQSLLNRLHKVKKTGTDSYISCCPSHNDKNPSLAIRQTNDGRILIKCFCGCSANEIVSAVGLSLSDLFPSSDSFKYTKQARSGLSAWQLMHTLKSDLVRLLIIANDLHKIKSLSDDDKSFIHEVIMRLNDGIHYLEGTR